MKSMMDYPTAVAFDPEGKFAYVTNLFSGNISACAIDQASGVLSPLSGSPFPVAPGPGYIAIVKITHWVSRALTLSPASKKPMINSESQWSGSANAADSSCGWQTPEAGQDLDDSSADAAYLSGDRRGGYR